VAYRAYLNDGTEVDVDNPSELPDPARLDHVDEPMLRATILTPAEYTGTVMDLCQGHRATMVKMEYLSPERVEFVYTIPLAEVVVNFFDQLKSRTKGYASLDYEPDGYETADLVKVDLLINHTPVDAFSTIVHRSQADFYGRKMTEKLRQLIPRQMFDVPIQAAIGRPGAGPRDGEGPSQGRVGQVLRRRHHPEAKAPREAEGGKEEDEEHRPGRGPPGGVRLRPPLDD
jgi:GTP-binding protein LepA